jgi:hypothetical protein
LAAHGFAWSDCEVIDNLKFKAAQFGFVWGLIEDNGQKCHGY